MATTITLSKDSNTFAALLQSYLQSGNINFLLGSGASMPAISLAGPIEEEINGLLIADKVPEANLKAYAFISNLVAQHAAALTKNPAEPLKRTLAAYREFATVLDRILFERKNLLLSRQANIFTTNYDLFVEHAASSLSSLIVNDGFLRSPKLAGDFAFAPENYFDRTYRSGTVYSQKSEVPTLNLVKLHGSLSWRKSGNDLVYRADVIPDLSADDQKVPDKVAAYLENYFVVLPNLRKLHATMMDRAYYDLLRIFANALERENAVLFAFGFSFDDEHILDVCRRSLRNPTAQLVVFSHDPDSVSKYEGKFDAQRNVLIVSPSTGERTDFVAMNGLLSSALSKSD